MARRNPQQQQFLHPEKTLHALEERLSRWLRNDAQIWPDPREAISFLDAVDLLLSTIKSWDTALSSNPSSSSASPLASHLDRAHSLLRHAVLCLEEEFRLLLHQPDVPIQQIQNSDLGDEDEVEDDEGEIPVAGPVTEFDFEIDLIPEPVIDNLREIAARVIASGFGDRICNLYATHRRDFLEESAARIGFGDGHEKQEDEEDSEDGQKLQREITIWVAALKLSVRVLLPAERRLSNLLFSGFPSAADLCFAESARLLTHRFLRFADSIANSCRSVERLYNVLDVYEALADHAPLLESLFSGGAACAFPSSEAAAVLSRLADAVRAIFQTFEGAIHGDAGKSAVPGAGVHPLTRYVMNYMRVACDYQKTLDAIFSADDDGAGGLEPVSGGFSMETAWVLELLMGNLELKSKMYRDNPAQRYIFLMNNGSYIVNKVKDSEELGGLLGMEWVRKQSSIVRQNRSWYLRNAWGKVVAFLDVSKGSGGEELLTVPKGVVREKMRLFNTALEEKVREQSEWVVADEQLLKELLNAIKEMVVASYQSFLGKYRQYLDGRSGSDRLIMRYSEEQLKGKIEELFSGRVAGER